MYKRRCAQKTSPMLIVLLQGHRMGLRPKTDEELGNILFGQPTVQIQLVLYFAFQVPI